MKLLKKLIITFFVINTLSLIAQKTIVNNEIGITFGPTIMQTDYGEAKNFSSTTNNFGFGMGISYTANFSESKYKNKQLVNHIKPKFEISFSKTSFMYDGKPVSDALKPQYANFKAMKGETKLINLGVFTEVYFRNISKKKKFSPYLLAGISFSNATPSLTTTAVLPNIYQPKEENIFMEKQQAFSYTGGLGFRYKFNKIDFILESRYQAFLSDKMEGLNSTISGNNYNDTQLLLNVGVVFNLTKLKEARYEFKKDINVKKNKPRTTKKRKHIAKDFDKDGFADHIDACPKRFSKVNNGCPGDRDNDGVLDDIDLCPNIAGLKKHNGCPLKKVIKDEKPTISTPKKKVVIEKISKKETETIMLKNIKTNLDFVNTQVYFELNSWDLSFISKIDLNKIASFMADNSKIQFILIGNTDKGGDPNYNQILSEKRCQAVKKYLIGKGAFEKNLEIIAYGEKNPKFENSMINSLNRRVDIKVKE